MPALIEPVAAARASTLRTAVLAFKAGERRRVVAPVLHLGEPAGPTVRYGVRAHEPLDHALRTEVVAALLLQARAKASAPVLWLTRPGDLAWHDVDAAWLPAAEAAYAEADVPLTFVVVTRQGWYDPRSGVTRRWQRLRDRRPSPSRPGA